MNRAVDINTAIGVVKSQGIRNFLTCPFCHTKQYKKYGLDQSVSYCEKCIKPFMVLWEKEVIING